MTERITPLISDKLSIGQLQVAATIELLTSGATILFISRYRKEATGSLDETQVAAIDAEMKRLDTLIKRKETILKSIGEQEKLTPELEAKINNCWDTTALEDLYLPYRPKRKTRASMARKRGLEPLATLILEQRERNLELRAELFLTDDVPDVEAALAGARDIIAERGVSQFQIIDNRLVFREGAQLQIAGLQSFQYGTMALPEAAVNTAQVLVHKNRLYIRNQVGIIVQTF